MADVNLPSFNLADMEFMSPLAYQQAANQIGLANQFQQQNLEMGQQDIRAKQLANALSEQSNPLKVQRQSLENQGLDYENQGKGVDTRIKTATEKEQLAAARQKILADMDDTKLKQFMSQASMELMSDDPTIAARGMRKIMASKEELVRRNEHADKLEEIQKQGENSARVAQIGAGATLGAARINADSRIQAATARAKGVMDFDQAVAMGKITPDKALTYATIQAQNAEDPEMKDKWTARAQQFEKIVQNKAAAAKIGNPDIGAMANIPTIQAPSAFAPQAPQTNPQVPSTLTDVSKMYPGVPADKLKEAYKKKFGVDLK